MIFLGRGTGAEKNTTIASNQIIISMEIYVDQKNCVCDKLVPKCPDKTLAVVASIVTIIL